jgi:hypothetical protein
MPENLLEEVLSAQKDATPSPKKRFGPRPKIKRPWQGLAKYPSLTGEPKLSVVLLI